MLIQVVYSFQAEKMLNYIWNTQVNNNVTDSIAKGTNDYHLLQEYFEVLKKEYVNENRHEFHLLS